MNGCKCWTSARYGSCLNLINDFLPTKKKNKVISIILLWLFKVLSSIPAYVQLHLSDVSISLIPEWDKIKSRKCNSYCKSGNEALNKAFSNDWQPSLIYPVDPSCHDSDGLVRVVSKKKKTERERGGKKRLSNLMHEKQKQMERRGWAVTTESLWAFISADIYTPSAITPKPCWCHCCNCFDTLKLALILFGQWLKLYGNRGHSGNVHQCSCPYWPGQHLFVLWCKWEAQIYYSAGFFCFFFKLTYSRGLMWWKSSLNVTWFKSLLKPTRWEVLKKECF